MIFWDIALGLLLALVVISDLRERRITNKTCIAILVLGIISHLYPPNAAALIDGVITAAVTFFVFLFFYTLGGLQAGDVKFVTSVAVWFGHKGTLLAVLIGVLLVIVAASVVLAIQGRLFHYWRYTLIRFSFPSLRQFLLTSRFSDSLYMPFGAFIAIGFLIVLFLGGGDAVWQDVVARH